MRNRLAVLLAGLVLAMPGAALAHTGVAPASGFAAGFLHPVAGLDHVLAMVAVGLWAAQIGGRALWIVPATFVTVMIAGAVLGMAAVTVPVVELGIIGSVLVLGGLVALGRALPLVLAAAVVGLFAAFHGVAHGTEMPVAASGLLYGLGFALATTLLHAAGLALGFAAQALQSRPLVRIGGGAIAATGLVLLVA
jgi:urease accessory protein